MTRQFRAHKPKAVQTAKHAGGAPVQPKPVKPAAADKRPKEIGGPSGPEPTRYGDWERKGICVDF